MTTGPALRKWTGPDDLRRELRRKWDSGALLRSEVTDDPLFPYRFRLSRPDNAELSSRYDEVRTWSRSLLELSYVRVVSSARGSRTIGRNEIPAEVWIDDINAAAGFLETADSLDVFRKCVVEPTRTRMPELVTWLAAHPMEALAVAPGWSRMLDVVDWMTAHPNPGIYLRQVDIPGVDTKFMERQAKVLASMLDAVLPENAIERDQSSFEGRFGFRQVPQTVRFRALDQTISIVTGAADRTVTLTLEDFGQVTGVERVFVTENYVNFLSFPAAPKSIVIFGQGYDVGKIARVPWIAAVPVLYWGDIDTHGFAILDHLRSLLPHVVSVLMDHSTLHAHQAQWGYEDSPLRRDLSHLTAAERALYDDLRDNVFRPNLRLEQELTSYGLIVAEVERLTDRAGCQ